MSDARVLHLIDGRPDADATPATLALLAASRRPDDAVVLLGGAWFVVAARAAGLDRYRRVGVPFASAMCGYPAARRALHDLGPIDLIHCWSPGAARFASRAMKGKPVALSVTRPVTAKAADGIAAWHRGRSAATRIVVFDPTWRQALIAVGIDSDAVSHLSPGIDRSLLSLDRAAVRASWGADDADHITALLDSTPLGNDAVQFALGLGLPAMLATQRGDARRFRLLMHPNQNRRAVARRLIGGFGAPALVRQDARLAAPWTVLAGCDAAVVTAGGGALLPWAMAAGVPILAEPVGLAGERLTHDRNALFAGGDDHRDLAHQYARLIADPALGRAIADRARADVAHCFDAQTYRRQLGDLYERLTSRKFL